MLMKLFFKGKSIDNTFTMIKEQLKSKDLRVLLFTAGSLILLTFALGFHHYTTSQVYAVYMDGVELGVVTDTRDVEDFVDELVVRCGELYGLELQLDKNIELSRQYRTDCEPDPESVRESIRERASFITTAYLLHINGKPIVPLASEDALQELITSLKSLYADGEAADNLTEVSIVEDLDLEVCLVSPDSLYSADDIIVLLSERKNLSEGAEDKTSLLASADTVQHSTLGSRFLLDRDYDNLNNNSFAKDNTDGGISDQALADLQIHVKTVEEITEIETIPFRVESIQDNDLYVNEKEITTEGINGEKEVLYQITRENGLEVERLELEEKILVEPVDQVEKVGQKPLEPVKQVEKVAQKPTSASGGGGGGSFIWPVQGQGTIYNGYRAGHLAIDIHIASGTNVLAADSGTVFFAGWGSTQGNYLILHHGAYWTLYLHNSANLVKAGDRVTRGQVIAKVGSTGRSTGAHLHFEIRADDGSRKWNSYYQHKQVNPLQFYNRR